MTNSSLQSKIEEINKLNQQTGQLLREVIEQLNQTSQPTPQVVKEEKNAVDHVDKVHVSTEKTKNRSEDDTPVKAGEGSASTQVEEEIEESSVGKTGMFNGEFVVMDSGKKFQVPPNYASKSMLVIGDKLKLLEEGDFNKFKLVEQVEREEHEALLTKKDNQWVAFVQNETIPNGSHEFRVVSAAIRFHKGEFGDNLTIVLPKGALANPPVWAAVKSVTKSEENLKRQKIDEERMDGVKPVNPYAKPPVEKAQPVDVSEPSVRSDKSDLKVDAKKEFVSTEVAPKSTKSTINLVNNVQELPLRPTGVANHVKPQGVVSTEAELQVKPQDKKQPANSTQSVLVEQPKHPTTSDSASATNLSTSPQAVTASNSVKTAQTEEVASSESEKATEKPVELPEGAMQPNDPYEIPELR